jgi:hypothetical protein
MNITTTGTNTYKFTFYPKGYLLKALKKANLPCTYHTLIKYEKIGVIKRPGAVISGSEDRFYTKDQIKEIIKEVRAYKIILKKSKKDEKYLKDYFEGR